MKPETSWGKKPARNQVIKMKVKININKTVNIQRKEKLTNLNTNIAERELTRAVNMMRERFSGRKFSG